MDLMLNAVEDDGSGGEGASPRTPNPPPPAFAMPVSRISASGSGGGASLSSILSAASPQTPQDAAPRFELPGASRRAGLAGLMNSPLADPASDREEQERRGGATPRDAAVEAVERPVAVIERSQEDHADVEMARDEDAEEEEEAEQGEEMEEDATENDESPVKRRRGYSIASEASVSTPPPMATSQSPASVALNADALVLEDAELAELKMALQQAIQRYLSAEAKANAPPAKRRKGKQPQKKRGSQAAAQAEASLAVSESIEAVEQCIARVHDKITMDLMEINVLRDVARMSITFLGIVNGADPVCVAAKTDIKTVLSTLQQKTVHVQLASAIRRVMLSVPEDAIPLVLGDVFDWIVTSGTDTAMWSWLFAFFAQFDSSAVVCFLVHHAAVQQPTIHEELEMKLTLPVLEFFSTNCSAELVDAVAKTLQHIASGSPLDGVAAQTALCRLVSIGLRSPVILHALDDSFQWVPSRELVQSLSKRCSEDSAIASNGAGEHQDTVISSKLLRLIDERSAELDNSILQCLLLLQQLMGLDSSGAFSDLARISRNFHADVLQIAQDQVNQSIVNSLSRRVSFIAQTCIELLSEDQGSSSTKVTESCLESWKSWLAVIATLICRRDVTDRLIQADLTAYEIGASGNSRTVPVESITELLCAIVEPSSPEFVVMLREISEWLRHLAASSSGRYRLLSVLEHLVDQVSSNRTPELYPLQFDHVAGLDDVDVIIDGFSRMNSCQDNWTQLEHWRATSGAELWEYLLDLITGVDPYNTDLSTHALNLLSKTPFPSLEDPLWQFRSIRKLTNAYFYGLRRYRVSLIDLDSPQQARREWRTQLQTLQSIIDRVCACNGAVAHYPSSVFSQFTSLWLDLLFSTTSATSVPTHFPSSTKGDSLVMKKPAAVSGERRDGVSAGEDQVLIRSERTISSKCTNLQSSQVITKHSDTLVYRKALDETWERELHAAFKCSALATKLLSQLVQTQLPDVDAEKSERRVKALVDMLLERATPCCGVPSDDVYKEILPNRSSFDVDLRIEQWLNHFPAFLPLLRLVIDHSVSSLSPTHSLRLVTIIKSALVVLVGHWNSVKGDLDIENMDVPPYMRNRNQVALSCELMRILRASGWLPEPLARAAELLPLTTPEDIRGILFSCWFFLADHPPSMASPQLQPSSNANSTQPKMPTEFYVLPVRKALHRNIHKIGAKYASFMC